MTALAWVAVALLGGVASLVRVVLGNAITARSRGGFPAGTLAINLSGSLLLGVLIGAALRGEGLVLAASATLGSYTTFSTWMLETDRLAHFGRRTQATVNVIATLTLGVGAVALGRAL